MPFRVRGLHEQRMTGQALSSYRSENPIRGNTARRRWWEMIKKASKIGICFFLGCLLAWAPCSVFAIDDSGVESSFKDFQLSWLKKLNEHGEYGPEHVDVKKDTKESGTYIATYKQLGEPQSSKVKKTGKKGSSYVGVLRYEEKTFASKGHTPEEASKGPFECEKTVVITEIFPFMNGKWVY